MEKEIELLNNIIATAVTNGGDSGGPYNTYEDELEESMKQYLKFRKMDNIYEVKNIDIADPMWIDTLQIVKKGFYVS